MRTSSGLIYLPAVLSISVACSIDASSSRVAGDVPDQATFAGPNQILTARCGSLDCHGDAYRNYRLYGYGGARLGSRLPNSDPNDVIDDEMAANYEATVGIEPERTSAIAKGKEKPESSTLIRKARGHERHVGGQRIVPGSDADRCLVGWLTNSPDEAACAAAP